MKRKAILVIAIMMIMPGANAAGIRSAAGQSQSAWNASVEYQSFQCPVGTSKGEGVDLNYTTDKSDDYYFVECNAIIVAPVPVITPAPSTNSIITPETTTATTKTDTPTVVSSIGSSTITTSTSTVSAPTTSFNWNAFMEQFNTWFGNWFATWFNSFFVKWLGL